jgi:hypothetical protein
MFEVVVTYRGDFSESLIDRFINRDEAEDVARRLALLHADKIVRAWVRVVRQARAKS